MRWCRCPVVRHCLVRVALCGGGDCFWRLVTLRAARYTPCVCHTAHPFPKGLHPPLSRRASFPPSSGRLADLGPEALLSPSCNNTSSLVAPWEWCQLLLCQPGCPLKRTRANIIGTALCHKGQQCDGGSAAGPPLHRRESSDSPEEKHHTKREPWPRHILHVHVLVGPTRLHIRIDPVHLPSSMCDSELYLYSPDVVTDFNLRRRQHSTPSKRQPR